MRERSRRRIAIGAMMLGLAWMPATVAAQEAGADPPLAPGDIVRIRLWQEPQLSGDYAVDERGTVSLPLVGDLQATGTPASRFKSEILEEYGKQLRNQNPQVTVLRRVRVLGAVGNPGLYHVDPTMTVGDAIALAGGVLPHGQEDDLRILRGDRVIRSSVRQSSSMTFIGSGDQIYVPQRNWLVRNAPVLIGAAASAITIVLTRR